MSKFKLREFLKFSFELILVIFQFIIIILHFIQWEFNLKNGLIPVNSVVSFFGFLLIIIASISMLLAIKELGSNFSPLPRPKVKGILITTGIYRLIRHPMYYSLILISFGIFITKFSIYYLCTTF